MPIEGLPPDLIDAAAGLPVPARAASYAHRRAAREENPPLEPVGPRHQHRLLGRRDDWRTSGQWQS